MSGKETPKLSPKAKEREFIAEFIQLYRELPSLWNVRSIEYKDCCKKSAAYETLLCKYKEMFPCASRDDVKKKINALRTNYRKVLRKQLRSMESGSDDVYQPNLWYYNEMSFLQCQESATESQSSTDAQSTDQVITQSIPSPGAGGSECSSLDNNFTQRDTPTVKTEQAPSTSYAVTKTTMKNSKRKLDDDILQMAADRLRETPDGYQNWALSCAADLRKMDPTQQIFAKHAIAAIIMEGQLGLLHRNSVKINTPTVTKMSPSSSYARSTPTPPRYVPYMLHMPQNQQNTEIPLDNFQQDNQQNDFQQVNDELDSDEDKESLSHLLDMNK